MKKIMTLALLLFANCATRSHNETPENDSKVRYVALNSREATMNFDGEVQFVFRSATLPLEDVRDKIEAQVAHLFGPMSEAARKAVPKDNHRITKISAKMIDPVNKVYSATYHYRGTVLVQNGSEFYDVVLPVDPSAIYMQGRVGNSTPCTDPHYNSEGDFWYFWNPFFRGCPLKKDVHFKIFTAKLTLLDNDLARTFPEYPRLADQTGTVQISWLLGLDDGEKSWDPAKTNDYKGPIFLTARQRLVSRGFVPVKKWEEGDFAALLARHTQQPVAVEKLKGGRPAQYPFVEEFEKVMPPGSRYRRILVRMYFGATGIDERSRTFHYLLKEAFENHSVMLYGGHSGLGGNLELAGINQANRFRMRPNPNRYQIYFFNSCSSYVYYNDMYFKPKRTPADRLGTKNLDIFTNGLATMGDKTTPTSGFLIEAIEEWGLTGRAKTFQQLAREIDSNNLFGINGDEDNPPM